MRLYAKSFTTAAILMVSIGVLAQEAHRLSDPDLLARLSYDRTATIQSESARHICLAVSHDGDYRIVRVLSDGRTERLLGKIQKEQLQRLTSLLEAAAFRALSGDHGGVILQESESFGAEIPRGEDTSQRVQWLNADGESPFPVSIAKVVDWLKHFEPRNAQSFDYAEGVDVCPSGGLRLIQPSVAAKARP